MIERQTVLVLGAGASIPLGFPSGRQLVTNVVHGLRKPTDQLFQILGACGFDATHITLFRDALEGSGRSSVDVFLEYRSEFLPLGKTAIAALLTPFEVEANLVTAERNWYEYLFRYLGPSLDDVAQSDLSVVTFNYDRSFEHYLFKALRNSFDLSTTKALEYFDHSIPGAPVYDHSIPVVHVYGKLGELPYVGGPDARSYQAPGAANLPAVALAVRDAIKIMHEGGPGNLALGRAAQLVREADVICFLGFGYLTANLERLRLDRRKPDAVVWGSAYDVGVGERAPILNFFARHEGKGHIQLGGPGQDVLEFLRQHPVLVGGARGRNVAGLPGTGGTRGEYRAAEVPVTSR